MIEFVDKSTVADGTPLDRTHLMAIQGFQSRTTVFFDDGRIVETNDEGHTLTTTFNKDGSVTETFVGDKTITLTTMFNADGSIVEVLS